MYVKKGDIIGWTSAGGEIDYSAINFNSEAPEFSYKPSDTLGFKFTRDSQPTLGHISFFSYFLISVCNTETFIYDVN